MRGVDDEGRQGAADAVVDALAPARVLGGRVEIECAGVVPMPHDGEPVEHRNLALLRDPAHVVGIGAERDHEFRARAVLHIHQDDVRTAFLQFLDAFLERGPKLFGVDPAHGIMVPVCHTTKSGLSSTSNLSMPSAISSAVWRGCGTTVTTLTPTPAAACLSAASSRAG